MPTRARFPKSRTALLLIDTINPFDFDGGRAFARKAIRVARRIAQLRERATRAGIPVIYVNDNLGKWRSDVYVVLKSTLSGFYQTPLETMLRLGGVKTLIVTGFAADNCVLFTAADAYMRDFRLLDPSTRLRLAR
jgi:nicotinamidase-related amidase